MISIDRSINQSMDGWMDMNHKKSIKNNISKLTLAPK